MVWYNHWHQNPNLFLLTIYSNNENVNQTYAATYNIIKRYDFSKMKNRSIDLKFELQAVQNICLLSFGKIANLFEKS